MEITWEEQIKKMVMNSHNFNQSDMDLIMMGFESAKTNLVSEAEANLDRDRMVREMKVTEFTIVADLLDKNSIEPIYIMSVPQETYVVIDKGEDKIVECKEDIDRFTGFQAVKVANILCAVKDNMLNDNVDLTLITTSDVDRYIGVLDCIDVFRLPSVVSSVDIEMIATQKKIYRGFLREFIVDTDKVLYIGGDFGAAPLRYYDYPIDCLYFDRDKFERSQKARMVNSTKGLDFCFEYEKKKDWYELLKGYTVIIHNFLFGDIYEDLLLLVKNKDITLIALGVSPDRTDKEIYVNDNELNTFLEGYKINIELANRHNFQILYEDDDYYITYIDHGRYLDHKPEGYDLQIPFFELDDWIKNKFYRAFAHLSVFITGPKAKFYKDFYYIPDGIIHKVQVLDSECFIAGVQVTLKGIDGLYVSYVHNTIFDINIPGPYWVRRLHLFNAGVAVLNCYGTKRRMLNNSGFAEPVDELELSFMDYVNERKIKPYIELRKISYNPIIKEIVCDSKAISYLFLISNEYDCIDKIRLGITENGELVRDALGPFYLVTSISYSRVVYKSMGTDYVALGEQGPGLSLEDLTAFEYT